MGGFVYEMLQTVFGGKIVNDLTQWMKWTLNCIDTAVHGMDTLINAFIAIAASLLVIYFFQDLMNQASKDLFSFEKLVVMFIRMLIAFCVLIYSNDIINMTIDLGRAFVAMVQSISSSDADFGFTIFQKPDYIEEYKGLIGGIRGACAMGSLLVPWVISWLADIMGKFLITSTTVMLSVRLVFSPMAIVQIFEDGSRSSGMRYIKSMIAEALSLAVMLAIIIAATAFAGSLTGEAMTAAGGTFSLKPSELNDSLTFTAFIPVIVSKLVIVGGMASGSKIAHDVMGA